MGESQIDLNPQLVDEEKKVVKWSTASSLLNTLMSSIVEIKETYGSDFNDRDAKNIYKGIIRAVNDMELYADERLVGRDVEFEVQEGQDIHVSEARSVIRESLIGKLNDITDENLRKDGFGGKMEDVIDGVRVVENYFRLKGSEKTLDTIKKINRENIGDDVYHFDPEYLSTILYRFDPWEDQFDHPAKKMDTEEYVERKYKIASVVKERLDSILKQSIQGLSSEYGRGKTDPDVIQALKASVIDVVIHSEIDFLWSELKNRKPNENSQIYSRRILNNRNDINSLTKKSRRIRHDLYKPFFKAYKDSIRQARKVGITRYGSREDLILLKDGIIKGVREFNWGTEQEEYFDMLFQTKLLSENDLKKAKEFQEFFEANSHRTTKFIGIDGRHSKSLEAVVLNKIDNINDYAKYLGIE